MPLSTRGTIHSPATKSNPLVNEQESTLRTQRSRDLRAARHCLSYGPWHELPSDFTRIQMYLNLDACEGRAVQ